MVAHILWRYSNSCVAEVFGAVVVPSASSVKCPNNTAGGCPLATNASTADEARLATSNLPRKHQDGNVWMGAPDLAGYRLSTGMR
jgi:hypothetical protein